MAARATATPAKMRERPATTPLWNTLTFGIWVRWCNVYADNPANVVVPTNLQLRQSSSIGFVWSLEAGSRMWNFSNSRVIIELWKTRDGERTRRGDTETGSPHDLKK